MSLDDDLLRAKDAKAARRALDAGASPNAVDEDGASALHHAVRRRTLELAELLVSRGATLDARDKEDGYTPLHIVCKSNSGVMSKSEIAAALWLIGKGAGVGTPSNDKETPLHLAAASGSHEVIDALFAKGATCTRDAWGNTPLHRCLSTNEKDDWIWEKLLAKGCTLEDKNDAGDTPLLEAQMNWNHFAVKWLLGQGADRNAKDEGGKTVLERAKDLKQEKVLKLLR